MFSLAWHRLHVFPRLARFTCFPALGTICRFPPAWHRLHVFQRLAQNTYFSALGTSSRCVFFPAHGAVYILSITRNLWYVSITEQGFHVSQPARRKCSISNGASSSARLIAFICVWPEAITAFGLFKSHMKTRPFKLHLTSLLVVLFF